MAKLDSNDAFQDRGLIKLTDGTNVVEITKDGELKTKDTFSDFKETKGGQKYIVVRDINETFSQILIQLKVIVAQNNEVHDLRMSETDVKEK